MQPEEDAIQERRRENLARWIKANCVGVADAARKIDKSDSLLRGVLAGKKSFGEKLARSIEENGRMPRGLLDKPVVADLNTPRQAQGPPGWPFSFPIDEFAGLDDDQKQRIEDTIRGMILGFSAQRTKVRKKA